MKTMFATRHLAVLTSSGPDALVEVRGELDLAGVSTFRDAVRELDVARRHCLVLDLGRLDFIDAAGLHAVLDLHDECLAAATALTILPGPRQVQRVFGLSGAAEFLPMAGVVDDRNERRTKNDSQ